MSDVVVARVIRIQDGGVLLLLLLGVVGACVVLRVARMPGSIKQLFNMLFQD